MAVGDYPRQAFRAYVEASYRRVSETEEFIIFDINAGIGGEEKANPAMRYPSSLILCSSLAAR